MYNLTYITKENNDKATKRSKTLTVSNNKHYDQYEFPFFVVNQIQHNTSIHNWQLIT